MLSIAILAGGLATRLHPITQTIPKALVNVANKPFISRQLTYLHAQGIRRVVVCTGYLGEMIQTFVKDGSSFGLEVLYSFDGPVLLGTGGALKQALPLLGDNFFVMYGDSFLPVDFKEVQSAFFQSNQAALMTVMNNSNRWDKSNVLFQDGEIKEYNKQAPKTNMHHIDYGLCVLSSQIFDAYPSHKAFDLAQVYQTLSIKRELAGLEVYKRFYEIGSHSGLKEAEDFFKED